MDMRSPKPACDSSTATMPRPALSRAPPVTLMYLLSMECSALRRSSPLSSEKEAHLRAACLRIRRPRKEAARQRESPRLQWRSCL
eukprot:7317373-Prymnesium_polylepis.2